MNHEPTNRANMIMNRAAHGLRMEASALRNHAEWLEREADHLDNVGAEDCPAPNFAPGAISERERLARKQLKPIPTDTRPTRNVALEPMTEIEQGIAATIGTNLDRAQAARDSEAA